jgi:hypothetical protein
MSPLVSLVTVSPQILNVCSTDHAYMPLLTLISAYTWEGLVGSVCQCVLILMANIFFANRYVET